MNGNTIDVQIYGDSQFPSIYLAKKLYLIFHS